MPYESERVMEIGVARRAAREAAKVASRSSESFVRGTSSKPVLVADIRGEEAARKIIAGEFADDPVLGEEEGGPRESYRLWLIDPLDGTVNFLRHSKRWCSAVALLQDGDAICSAMARPGGKSWSAEKGNGAWEDGNRLLVARRGTRLQDAIVSTHLSPEHATNHGEHLLRLARSCASLRSSGSGSMDLVDLAKGNVQGWLQPDVSPWDWEPGALLVREAGGATGEKDIWKCAAENEDLLQEILDLV